MVPGGFWVTNQSISTVNHTTGYAKTLTIINDPADALDLVDDPRRHLPQKLAVEIKPIRRHEIRSLNCSQRNNLVIHPLVSHHTNSPARQESGIRLANLSVQARSLNLADEDVVGLPCNFNLLGVNLAENADGDAGPGEGVAPNEVLGDAKAGAELADFVLEELTEGLDELEVHVCGETADILWQSQH